MGNLHFSPGETNVYEAQFSPTVLLFWLKTEIAATNMRVVSKSPNTIFGILPLGYKDTAIPMNSVAGVGVEVKFSLLRLIVGLIFLFTGVAISDNLFGWILLLLGISFTLNSFSAALAVQNHGGAVTHMRVSVLEKQKLEQMRDAINQRLFTDAAGLRHQESMDMSRAQLLNQQAQLNLQQQQNQPQPNVQQPPTAPETPQPPTGQNPPMGQTPPTPPPGPAAQ